MSNFSNSVRDVKADFMLFASEFVIPSCDRPRAKFIIDMAYGILRSGSSLVSEVARALDEGAGLNTPEKRLTRGLAGFDLSGAAAGFMSRVASRMIPVPFEVEVDESDVAKPCGKAFEAIGWIHDGSKEGRPKEKGYLVTGMIGLGGGKTPVPLHLEVYSTSMEGYKSLYWQTVGGLSSFSESIAEGASGTVAFDRGYDSSAYANWCWEKGYHFMIRAKNTRRYRTKHGYETAFQIASRYKGRYSTSFRNGDGELVSVKFSPIAIEHRDFLHPMWIVMEWFPREKERRVYITNADCSDKRGCVDALRSYRMRWRIEEFFRFVKQEYGLERFMVRGLASINGLAFCITVAVVFISRTIIAKGRVYRDCLNAYRSFSDKVMEEGIIKEYGEEGLMMYRVKRGMKAILAHSKSVPKIPGRDRRKEKGPIQLKLF